MISIPHKMRATAPSPPPLSDTEFVSAAHWLAQDVVRPSLVVLGVPFCGGSISHGRMDLAPWAIRESLVKFSCWSSDFEVDLLHLPVMDLGEVEPADDVVTTQARTKEAVAAVVEQTDVPVVIFGGDNSITVGAALGADADALLTFDAHHDCRDPANGPNNGTPVRQLLGEGLQRVAQIGIHGFANAEPHARWAREHGVRWFSANDASERGIDVVLEDAMRTVLAPARRIWVDFDIDVLDRAFAPGAPASMPGGLRPSDLTKAAFVLGRDPGVAGIDIVEVDPMVDDSSITVRSACAVFLAFACGVASR